MSNPINAFYKAQGRHSAQLRALIGKGVSKWKDEDFAAVQATRAARDSAVAALTAEQKEKVGEFLAADAALEKAVRS